jgi:methyl-accepting chemotaxis protein
MIAHTPNIRSTVNNSVKITEKLTNLSKDGQQIIQRLGDEYRMIAQRSGPLKAANKIISNMAAETNILAIEEGIRGSRGQCFPCLTGT